MSSKTFGYIRVSSKDQNESRQSKELLDLGIDERDIFLDKQSGKDFNRPQYQALKQCLREGDILYIKSIDRFGRNNKEIRREWEYITQQIKADIKVLDMPLLDTTLYKDLIGDFVSDLVLSVLSFVAEQERNNIKQRQSEGIAIAKAKGVKLGRPSVKIGPEFNEVYTRWKISEITAVKAMQLLNLKKTTFYSIIKEYEKHKK